MSPPIDVGSFRFQPLLSVTTDADGLRWSASGPGGRIRPVPDGFVADSLSFIATERTPAVATPRDAAAAAMLREAYLGPVAAGIAVAFGGPAAVLFMDGNHPDARWPWPADAAARPVGLTPWERRAVAAAAVYRRYSLIIKDLDSGRIWVIEATAGGVGVVRMPQGDETASTRWLARGGQKRRLMGGSR